MEETGKDVDTMFDIGGALDGAGCGLVFLFFITGLALGTIFILGTVI